MSRLNRLMWTGLALGVAACGDDVTVQPPAPPPVTVTVTPDGATIAVGATLQMSAAVSGGPGGTPTIAWSSSSTAVASVSGTGLVTGVAAGAAGITATATVGTSSGAGSATVTVTAGGSQLPPTVSIGSITNTVAGTGEVPVNLGAVAGQINVHVNLERNNNPIQRVELLMKTPSGADTIVASQSFSASAPVDASPELVPELLTLSVNTAAFNALTGAAAFHNGPNGVTARAVGAAGSETAQNAVQFTLANPPGFVVELTFTKVSSATGTANDSDGRIWTEGDITMNAIGVTYSSLTITSVVIDADRRCDIDGDGFDDGDGPLNAVSGPSATWAKADSDADDGSRNYQTPEFGCMPSIGGSVLSNGQQGPTTVLNNLILRHDNLAPVVDDNDPIATDFGEDWVNATTDLTDYFNVDDGNGVGVDHSTAYSWYRIGAASAFPSLSTCSTSGMTQFAATSELPENADGDASLPLKARSLYVDKLGNRGCANINAGGDPFGVDFHNPTIDDIDGPDDGDGLNVNGAGNSDYTVTASDNASLFGATPVFARVFRATLTSGSFNTVVIGSTGSVSTAEPVAVGFNFDIDPGALTDGYHQVEIAGVCDQAANCAVPAGFPRVVLMDDEVPTFTGVVTPPGSINAYGAYSFSGIVNDNADINGAHGVLSYGGGAWIFRGASNSFGAFGLPHLQTQNFSYSADVFRCLHGPGDYTGAGANLFDNIDIVASDFAANSAIASAAILAGSLQACVAIDGDGVGVGTDLASFIVEPTDGADDISKDGDTAGDPTSVTLRAVVGVTPDVSGVNPFGRVNFYYLDPGDGQLKLIASVTSASGSASAGVRRFTYSTSWNPPSSLPDGPVTIWAVGIVTTGAGNRSGNALVTDAGNADINLTP